MLGSRPALIGLMCLSMGGGPHASGGLPGAQDSLAARLASADDLSDPVMRANRRSAIFFEARDFAGVLKEVSAGLQHDPLALELLRRASASELWLGDGERALSWLERLRDAANASELESMQREYWLAAASDFENQANQLLETEAAGLEALSRARLTIGGSVLGALGLIVWLVAEERKRRSR